MRNVWIVLVLFPAIVWGQFDVSLQPFASGFDNPCNIANAGDERLFVVEQGGKIKIIYPNGSIETNPFLNITSKVNSGGEKGLLGLAFAPDYCTSGKFYVNYTFSESGQLKTRISRFSVNPDNENEALANSEESLIEFNQPFSNHNGGHLEFGPDGYLYIGTGDGGSGGDPNNNAQNTESMLGKFLRIDVSTNTSYSIPADNPFVDSDGLDEIWAYGLRNPWKFAFDSQTGDLYIGDVGQNAIEEVNFEPAGYAGGGNYGWRCYEGNTEYNMSECSDVGEVIDPIFEYYHNQGHCSITGGRVYRGNSFDNLSGKYIVCDWCSGYYWLVWEENGVWQNYDGGLLGGGVVAFGEDVWGEMYAVKLGDGSIWRVLEGGESVQSHISMINGNMLISNLEGSEYAWYLNGNLIDGANGQTLEFFENGVYSVIITSNTGCTIEANPYEVINVSVKDHSAIQTFRVFPNPASSSLNIEVEMRGDVARDIQIYLFDITGKEVLKFQAKKNTISHQIDVSRLHSGIYFLYCKDNKGETLAIRKIVVD